MEVFYDNLNNMNTYIDYLKSIHDFKLKKADIQKIDHMIQVDKNTLNNIKMNLSLLHGAYNDGYNMIVLKNKIYLYPNEYIQCYIQAGKLKTIFLDHYQIKKLDYLINLEKHV